MDTRRRRVFLSDPFNDSCCASATASVSACLESALPVRAPPRSAIAHPRLSPTVTCSTGERAIDNQTTGELLAVAG